MNGWQLSRRSILLGTGASLASLALRGTAPAALAEGSAAAGASAWTIGNDQVKRSCTR